MESNDTSHSVWRRSFHFQLSIIPWQDYCAQESTIRLLRTWVVPQIDITRSTGGAVASDSPVATLLVMRTTAVTLDDSPLVTYGSD